MAVNSLIGNDPRAVAPYGRAAETLASAHNVKKALPMIVFRLSCTCARPQKISAVFEFDLVTFRLTTVPFDVLAAYDS